MIRLPASELKFQVEFVNWVMVAVLLPDTFSTISVLAWVLVFVTAAVRVILSASWSAVALAFNLTVSVFTFPRALLLCARIRAGIDHRVAGVGIVTAQGQSTAASLGQSAAAANGAVLGHRLAGADIEGAAAAVEADVTAGGEIGGDSQRAAAEGQWRAEPLPRLPSVLMLTVPALMVVVPEYELLPPRTRMPVEPVARVRLPGPLIAPEIVRATAALSVTIKSLFSRTGAAMVLLPVVPPATLNVALVPEVPAMPGFRRRHC